jgi:hypothetical protein
MKSSPAKISATNTVDLDVTADARARADVEGPWDLVRAFPTWIGVSPFADRREPALAGGAPG